MRTNAFWLTVAGVVAFTGCSPKFPDPSVSEQPLSAWVAKLADQDPAVKQRAIDAISKVRKEDAGRVQEPLRKFAADPQEPSWARGEAACLLHLFFGEDVPVDRAVLVGIMRTRSDQAMGWSAVNVLAARKADRGDVTVDALLTLIGNYPERACLASMDLLEKIGPAALPLVEPRLTELEGKKLSYVRTVVMDLKQQQGRAALDTKTAAK